jgi:hypothetical protein
VQAGTEIYGSRTFVFNESVVAEYGYVAASLSGPQLQVKNDYSLGWVPIGKPMTVTESEGYRIHSIDNISIGELYKKYLKIDTEQAELTDSMLHFPFIIEYEDALQTVILVHGDSDGSFVFLQSVNPGKRVRFSYYDVITQVDSL